MTSIYVVVAVAAALAGASALDVTEGDFSGKLVVFPSLIGGNMSLSVATGEEFRMQISDMSSTGFNWYFDSIKPKGLAGPHGHKDIGDADLVHGGGVTGPPYINVTLVAGQEAGSGRIVLEHVKSWEKADPKAMRGYAVLSLTVTAKDADSKPIIV